MSCRLQCEYSEWPLQQLFNMCQFVGNAEAYAPDKSSFLNWLRLISASMSSIQLENGVLNWNPSQSGQKLI